MLVAHLLRDYLDTRIVIVPAEPLLMMMSSLPRAIVSARMMPRSGATDVPVGTSREDTRTPPPLWPRNKRTVAAFIHVTAKS
jgi:hypothetical protein